MYEINTEDLLKAQNNDNEAMTNIIQANAGLLWSIIKRFLGRGYDKEELYQIACIGFIKAIKRFDIKYDVRLSTYAVPYILGEIKRFIRDDGLIKISRNLKELTIKIKEVQKEYLTKKGEEINIIQIAKILKIPKEEVVFALESEIPVESINEEIYENDLKGETKLSKIDNSQNETEILINKICLNNIIKNLNQREQKIIILRYYNEKTQSEVAKILGITQVQVSRLEKKILLKMRQKISIKTDNGDGTRTL
ncbi:MAG: sigma-70 family RNA polymerase sigma factor [Clostridia bacterium]|nr:sigma-70 family RNA polymerase sigma factor [Clostridia bacterium]